MKKPQRVTIGELYGRLQPKQLLEARIFYGDGFGVAVNTGPLFAQVITPGEAYLIEDYRIGFTCSGHIRSIINLVEHDITPGKAIFVTPGSIVEPVEFSDDYAMYGMVVPADVFRLALGNSLPFPFDGKMKGGVVDIGKEDVELAHKLFDLLYIFAQKRDQNRLAFNGIVSAIVGMWGSLFAAASVSNPQQSAANCIFDRFIALVNDNCTQHRSLSFYADSLCITERYLGAAVRQVSGTTPKDWIDHAVISAAKVLLKYSDASIGEVADVLSFPNPSFFCKFFKRFVGTSPQAYRNSQSTPES